MPASSKDTIYVDIDDEITALIDKVKNSDKKIVALVLPKRAAVLQSIVNMKLLKRTADESKKRIVLITSESGIIPLAGAVGLHVASTLQSKPAIPAAPKTVENPMADNAEVVEDVPIDTSKPVGELADDDQPIVVDNEDKPVKAGAAAAATKKAGKKKISIPNFDKFRFKVVLGAFAVLLLSVFLFYATQVAPAAKVVIKTDSSTIPTELKLTVNPSASEVNEEDGVIPGSLKEVKKTDSETVPTTGQVDRGEKAKGSVSLKNCSASVEQVTIPAGTGVSNGNLTFITDKAVTLPATTKNGLNQCTTSAKDVDVTAQNGGDRYNISGNRTFTVSGYSAVSGVDSSPMTGGTSVITKTVAQKDIDDARQKIQDRSDAARDELLGEMEQIGILGIRETFAVKGQPVVSPSPNVNENGENVTVRVETTYTLLGVSKEDLKELVKKSAEGKYDQEKQVILDDGLDEARIIVDEKRPNGEVGVTVRTSVLAGPQLDEEAIKQEIAGKKKSQSISAVQSRPGIKEAEISYSPFWVSSTPKKTSKISVTFEQNNTASDNADD